MMPDHYGCQSSNKSPTCKVRLHWHSLCYCSQCQHIWASWSRQLFLLGLYGYRHPTTVSWWTFLVKVLHIWHASPFEIRSCRTVHNSHTFVQTVLTWTQQRLCILWLYVTVWNYYPCNCQAIADTWVRWQSSGVCDFVCVLSVCLCSKRKTAWATNTNLLAVLRKGQKIKVQGHMVMIMVAVLQLVAICAASMEWHVNNTAKVF